jgi:16S rRNA (uracil1498-N3)-methyltransferase
LIELPADQAHHLIRVLRLGEGDEVQAFDAAGAAGSAIIAGVTGKKVTLRIDRIEKGDDSEQQLAVSSAIPKGARADWMVEKLSELGTNVFIPLITERGIVVPEGTHKLERWQRLAAESAEQSRRNGLMRIEGPVGLTELLKRAAGEKWAISHLSTREDAEPFLKWIESHGGNVMLLIGPEGGWTESEEKAFAQAGAAGTRLTQTCLRIETAAVAAAAVAQMSLTAARAGGTMRGRKPS